MNWLLTTILCVMLVELALRLPFAGVIAGVSKSGSKAILVIRTKAVSDHWKEKALAAYAQTTFFSSVKLAGLLVILLTIAAVVVIALEQISDEFQGFILSWRGIGFSVAFASFYLLVRNVILNGRL